MVRLDDDSTVYLPIGALTGQPRRLEYKQRRLVRDKGLLSGWTAAGWLGIAAGLALWLVALPDTDLGRINGYGLVPALPGLWYAALGVLIVVAGATALACPARSALTGSAAIAVIAVLHATPALLYDGPRYTWTYKHIGVTQTILERHDLPRAADIYFDWPGFFTAAGWISDATGIPVADLATWSPPFFNLCFAAAVSFVAQGLTKDLRIVRLTVLLFVLTNWVGQDYFAPQAYAFTATLVLTGVLLRTTPLAERRTATDLGVARIRRLIAGRAGVDPAGIYGMFSAIDLGTAARTATVLLLWVAIVTSHQLSPIFALLTVVAIGAARGRIRWGLLASMVAIEAAWVVYGYPYLSHHGFSLFDFDPLHRSGPSGIDDNPVMPGVHVRAAAVYLLYFGMFALGVTGGLLRVRRGRIDMAPVLVAVSPITMLVMQNYGGEGQLRIYLFALPYLAFLVAWLFVTVGERRLRGVRVQAVVAATLACALVAPFLLAYYGQEKINRVTGEDVAAVRWFYDHATPGEWLCFAAPSLPSRVTGNYVDFPVRSDTDPNLLSSEEFKKDPSVENVLRFLDGVDGDPYLVFTHSQQDYLELFGIMPPATYQDLRRRLDESPRLRRVYRTDQTSIWQLIRTS
ncbi:hypothetical protein [Dactylosporangium sp. NPDC051541]|uniref:hypothetical protein n=1 Tax=Dactylosporangium sp. NPDC051541 TaxID=3363977 RepID=UPI00379568DF